MSFSPSSLGTNPPAAAVTGMDDNAKAQSAQTRNFLALIRNLDVCTPETLLPNGQAAGQFATDQVFYNYQKKRKLNNNQSLMISEKRKKDEQALEKHRRKQARQEKKKIKDATNSATASGGAMVVSGKRKK